MSFPVALFDDRAGAEAYVRQIIAGPSREVDPGDFDVAGIADELREHVSSWCKIPAVGVDDFWTVVERHAMPECPDWCEARGSDHWTRVQPGAPLEATHVRRFGDVEVHVGHEVAVDGTATWWPVEVRQSAPIPSTDEQDVQILHTPAHALELASHLANAVAFSLTLEPSQTSA